MYLYYSTYDILLEFERDVHFLTFPSFIFHSVIGKELRRISCLFKDKECSLCPIKNTCPYSVFFVTPISKDNILLKGRDKAPHPYIIYVNKIIYDNTVKLQLRLTIFGKYREQFPYIYYSIMNAGKRGIFKERVKYSVISVKSGNIEILKEDGNLNVDIEPEIWELNNNESYTDNKKLRISFLSPLRIKSHGSFVSDITFDDIVTSSKRRIELLTGLYGENGYDTINDLNYKILSFDKDITWIDYKYYSARQKERLKLGGLIGNITLEGSFDKKTLSILKAGEIFHIGKNPSFGLGRIKVEQID